MFSLLAQLPPMSDATLVNGTLFTASILVAVDRLVSIWANLRSGRAAVIPKEQLEERCNAHRSQMDALQEQIDAVDESRSRDVRLLCEKVETSNHSVSAALNDVARAMGRIEGGQEVARAIKEGFELLAKKV